MRFRGTNSLRSVPSSAFVLEGRDHPDTASQGAGCRPGDRHRDHGLYSGNPSLHSRREVHQIYSLLQAGKKHGMQTMNDSLSYLYMKGDCALEEAIKRSPDQNEFLRSVGEPVPSGMD